MKIAYIAAGAGGMYCGSCLHDNTLAAAMQRRGHDVALLPTYTPMRTDEENVSQREVFYGAVNVYLQGKSSLFRRTPRFLDRLLDRPLLLKWISRLGASTNAEELGELALSVLQGEQGPQKKELERLVAWLRDVYQPELVQITNSMFLGLVRRLKQELKVPVVVALQGEDLFVDELTEPARSAVIAEMRARAREADAFIVPSNYYALHMKELLAIDQEKLKVVPLGIHLPAVAKPSASARLDGEPLTIGYLARICPEKGLHVLLEAFHLLQDSPEGATARLRIAGYLGPKDRAYFEQQMKRVSGWRLSDRVEYVGELDLDQKARFLESLDILSVPTVYREPKGLFVLEALAHGVPVVQPRHGSFPEMIEATGGGILVDPESSPALAEGLRRLLSDSAERRRLGETGRRPVEERFTDEAMAKATLDAYREIAGGGKTATPPLQGAGAL